MYTLSYTKPFQPLRHHGVKTSTLPAVEIPHPGASYNPTFDDHQVRDSYTSDID